MKILFYDGAASVAYSLDILKKQALGGTEATVIRVAHALQHTHTVYIAQRCRAVRDEAVIDEVHYISLITARQLSPEVVILLREYRQVAKIANDFPQARHFLWLHNMPSRELYSQRTALIRYQYHIIAVSQFHRRAIEKRLCGKWFQRFLNPYHSENTIPVHVLYNPLEDALQPDDTPWNPTQFIFTSAPQKGLAETLALFKRVRQYFPEYHLLIANPGYSDMNLILPEQVHFLGALPHQQLIKHIRKSFCVFYPQSVRVETFGLVYAEANAVGTPVLALDSGAASEVLSDTRQMVESDSLTAVLEKLAEWRRQRPVLRGKPEFTLEKVKRAWLGVLEGCY